MKRGRCRECGALIVWIKTTAGKSMPCNADPVAYWAKPKAPGKVVTPNGEVISCEFSGVPNDVTGYGYIPHWATCPAAKRFRQQ